MRSLVAKWNKKQHLRFRTDVLNWWLIVFWKSNVTFVLFVGPALVIWISCRMSLVLHLMLWRVMLQPLWSLAMFGVHTLYISMMCVAVTPWFHPFSKGKWWWYEWVAKVECSFSTVGLGCKNSYPTSASSEPRSLQYFWLHSSTCLYQYMLYHSIISILNAGELPNPSRLLLRIYTSSIRFVACLHWSLGEKTWKGRRSKGLLGLQISTVRFFGPFTP